MPEAGWKVDGILNRFWLVLLLLNVMEFNLIFIFLMNFLIPISNCSTGVVLFTGTNERPFWRRLACCFLILKCLDRFKMPNFLSCFFSTSGSSNSILLVLRVSGWFGLFSFLDQVDLTNYHKCSYQCMNSNGFHQLWD